MEGSSSGNNGSGDPDFEMFCFCGKPTPLRKSGTQKNPGRSLALDVWLIYFEIIFCSDGPADGAGGGAGAGVGAEAGRAIEANRNHGRAGENIKQKKKKAVVVSYEKPRKRTSSGTMNLTHMSLKLIPRDNPEHNPGLFLLSSGSKEDDEEKQTGGGDLFTVLARRERGRHEDGDEVLLQSR
ncbi:hypothetical protein RHGRI_001181 [Rhododendron griersonianum]|uniref:Uncharacterized protein n=1 Tax=Rhododendron griersonianum TaxID=479676 RepID=A0AAV6LJ89_9ERIC|nr:hypothetical protein RHGRI_001181 [Rhododendron griersonianum]